jgi:hypothetical protein
LKRLLLLVVTILVTPNTSFAKTDTTSININTNYTPFVNLAGSVVGLDKTFAAGDIKPRGNRRKGPKMTLGTLGLESNISGSCSLKFSSQNTYKLRHVVSNKLLTRYILRYQGNRITRKKTEIVVPCDQAIKPLIFRAVGRFRRNVKTGTYRDIVTITVTTQ